MPIPAKRMKLICAVWSRSTGYAGVKEGVLCLNLCAYELNSGGRMMEAAFKAAGAGVIPLGSDQHTG